MKNTRRRGSRPPQRRSTSTVNPRRRSSRNPASVRASTSRRPPTPRRHSAKHRSIPVTLIAGLVFCIVMSYIVNAAVSLSNRIEIPSVPVQMGSLDAPVIFNGVIIRNEVLYRAPMSGSVSFNYNDLERVRRGTTVCEIYDEDAVAELAANIDEINDAILRLQERRSDITAFRDDIDSINNQIKSIVDDKAIISIQDDFSAVFAVRDAITQNLNLRNQVLLHESRGSLSALASDRQHYENEMNRNFSSIYAEQSGIVSHTVDGFEEVFTFEQLDSITPEQTRMSIERESFIRERNVTQGDPVFKMLVSNDWYIASYIPMEYVFDWSEGQTRTIYLQQGNQFVPVSMTVEKIRQADTEHYVLLRSTRNVLDYIHMRSVNFKISNDSHRGYQIPVSAIVDRTLLKIPEEYVISGDIFEVIRHTELADERIQVDVQRTGDEFVYISQEIGRLVLHDSIKLPTEPYTLHEITEVLNVKGVYIINRGYAEFRTITLDPLIPIIGDYVILDPQTNRELRLHDRIISDARSIYAEQRIVE